MSCSQIFWVFEAVTAFYLLGICGSLCGFSADWLLMYSKEDRMVNHFFYEENGLRAEVSARQFHFFT